MSQIGVSYVEREQANAETTAFYDAAEGPTDSSAAP